MYKPKADSTLMRMTKREIIEELRIAEHNAAAWEQTVNQQAKNMENWMPVVRCKDCEYWDERDHSRYDKDCCMCALRGDGYTNPFYFCADGERRESEEKDDG